MAHRDLATSDDGAGDPQSGHPADVADDVVQLVIHVRHRLLEVLHVRRGVFEMPILNPYGGPQRLPPGARTNADLAPRHIKRCALRRQLSGYCAVLECLSVSSRIRPSSPPPALTNEGDNSFDAGKARTYSQGL